MATSLLAARRGIGNIYTCWSWHFTIEVWVQLHLHRLRLTTQASYRAAVVRYSAPHRQFVQMLRQHVAATRDRKSINSAQQRHSPEDPLGAVVLSPQCKRGNEVKTLPGLDSVSWRLVHAAALAVLGLHSKGKQWESGRQGL